MLRKQLLDLLNKQSKKSTTLQFGYSSSKLNDDFHYSSTTEDQVFHATSVGKLMTSTLIFMAIEENLLTLDTPIQNNLNQQVTKELFFNDDTTEVTIKHLLSHTSGVNDYFEGKTIDKTKFIDLVLNEPNKIWTPLELIEFTQEHQQPLSKPGKEFHYSDTGYVLLGLILEEVYQKPFHILLHEKILTPCDMTQSGLSFYSESFDQSKLAPMIVNNKEVSQYNSLSCDWAGGGIYTTTKDLLKFLKKFSKGQLISHDSLNTMRAFSNKFISGIHYGLGLMQVHFNEFFFLLKGFPNLEGHIGITSVHAFYDPQTLDCYVLNMGNTKDVPKSIRLLIKIIQLTK